MLCSAQPAFADDSPLIDAAKRGDGSAVRALLQQKVDVNAVQPDGTTALHWAVHRDDMDLTALLIRSGAKVESANELGVTPLALACSNGNGLIVEALLKSGASAVRTFPDRPPAIMLCARSGSVEGVRALLAQGANVNAREPLHNQTALMWAVAQKHPAIVRLLLERGAEVGARSAITPRMVNRSDPNQIYIAVVGEIPSGGSTALLVAARHGDVESTRLLLDGGANVNDTAPDGTSALVIAVHSGHRGVAALLLARGANVNADGAGYTALHAAVLLGDIGLVNDVLSRGASVDPPLRHGTTTTRAGRGLVLPENLAGATPLLLAAKFLEVDIMRTLVSRGADPSRTLNDRTTVLMLVAGSHSHGPLFDRRGRIALLDLSDENAALQAVELSLSLGNRVAAANADGDTALHGAAARGYPAVAKLLLARGASPDVKNAKGANPLDVAGLAAVRSVLNEARRP
jgi:ankyrin repeat protein